MNIVIVIPTYNEADNVSKMIYALESEFKAVPYHTWQILIVDDSSPDGTAQIVLAKAKEFPNVHLLLRKEKKGLGVAYANGFKYAMQNLNADVLVEMDADFQHEPKDVVRLVAELDNGYDYAIGSRFVKGGSIPKDWAVYRKLLSVGGNIFSKIVLGIFNVTDFTSGFKASRVKGFVDHMDLDAILSGGFAYKIDLLYRMHLLGAKIKEVPIKFGLRDKGDSKMQKNNAVDSLRVVLTLRLNHNKRFFRFLAVGVIGLVVDEGLFNLLRLTLLDSRYATLVSGFTAMTATYLLNNFWSFKDTKLKGFTQRVLSVLAYYGSSYVPIIFRSFLISAAVSHFGDTFLISNVAQFIGIIIGLIWNFTVYSKLIWRKMHA
jgi:dolichol-phosphate mannosyltransferase